MFENITQNNGWNISFSGILIVFVGLVMISLVIYLFNLVFVVLCRRRERADKPCSEAEWTVDRTGKKIPKEHLVAIAVAVEFYRKIHFDFLQSEITFSRGDNAHAGWKIGHFYGQRSKRTAS